MDEVIDAALETPVDAPVDTQDAPAPVDDTGTPPVDPNEAMWGDLKEDAPADPNAVAPAVPEEFSKLLTMSDYVREPQHVEAAIQTAGEVWDVVQGKSSAAGLLEAMRAQNPTQYEKTIMEDIVPYIEKITGKRFGATDAAPDPMAELRAEVERLKTQPQIEAQQRQQQEQINQAETLSRTKVEEFIKGGNGIFDGDVQGAIQSIAGQLPKLGITPADLMKQVLGGNTATLEKAYKAAEKAETLKAKAYSDRIRAKFNTLKKSVPAAKAGGSIASPGDDNPDMNTQSGRVKWMAQQFAAGDG